MQSRGRGPGKTIGPGNMPGMDARRSDMRLSAPSARRTVRPTQRSTCAPRSRVSTASPAANRSTGTAPPGTAIIVPSVKQAMFRSMKATSVFPALSFTL